MIELKSITKTFRETSERNIHVLKGVDLKIQEGDKISIIGPSGCGKSTLLKIISTIMEADSGQYLLNGEIINSSQYQREAFRKNDLGFIFQDYKLIKELNVYENISLGLRAKEKLHKKDELKKVEDVLTQLGIENKIHSKVKNLSGGEMQRVGIARALIKNPKIIIADEPTGSLDYEIGKEIVSEILKLDTIVICVTHDIDVAKRFQQIYKLENGELKNVQKGSILY